jgi:hypothetical protein
VLAVEFALGRPEHRLVVEFVILLLGDEKKASGGV